MLTNGIASFDRWIGGRSVQSLGTNSGADVLPFQSWRHFKEAFAPELIRRAVTESPITVHRCLDPFGGSGTTALACQFLGVRPTTIEVNPFLADLIEAKLAIYDIEAIARDFGHLVKTANSLNVDAIDFYRSAPQSFVEPGIKDRWIFDAPVAARLASYATALSLTDNETNQRLFRVLLGGILVGMSNVVISGKGRRYRRSWQQRRRSVAEFDEAFCRSLEAAVVDIMRYADRAERGYAVLRGDARQLVPASEQVEISVFSPPYPNSFDYTDVYNIELWGLHYLRSPKENTKLRLDTISSHVQLHREFAAAPTASPLLDEALEKLRAKRKVLWDERIPEMVGGYFYDIKDVIEQVVDRLSPKGQIWLVVGDSGYGGVRIPVADILCELASSINCEVITNEPFRSMRTSVQQGRHESLNETLLVLCHRQELP
jgi:hypothetical protein